MKILSFLKIRKKAKTEIRDMKVIEYCEFLANERKKNLKIINRPT